MAYTETTTTWYWARLWNSLKWILMWIVLIFASITLLWWNEWRTIDVTQWLAEWKKITVNWEVSPIDNNLDWNLIYINWKATTDEILTDDIFFVSDTSIKLIRKVEMFQWKENTKTEKKDNMWWSETTTTTYTYEKIWNENKLSSTNFKESWHDNPANWPYEKLEQIAEDVKVWDIQLTSSFINQINKETQISIKDYSFNKFIKNSKIKNAKNLNNLIYIWNWSINNPEIWDLRISFSAVYPAEISAIWQQNWEKLVSYTTKTDTSINLLQYWTVSIEDMYKKANDDNMFLAWILRWVWLALMYMWFKLLFGLIITLAKVLPFLSSIIGVWTWIISFILTLIIWWWTIIIAWFFVRPLISIIILTWIVWAIFSMKKFMPKKEVSEK